MQTTPHPKWLFLTDMPLLRDVSRVARCKEGSKNVKEAEGWVDQPAHLAVLFDIM